MVGFLPLTSPFSPGNIGEISRILTARGPVVNVASFPAGPPGVTMDSFPECLSTLETGDPAG